MTRLNRRIDLGVCGLFALSLGLVHCSSSDSAESGAFAPYGTSGGASSGGTGSVPPPSGGSGGSVTPPPPEKELESSFQSPVATGRFVWTANPASGRVALVDAFDFQVTIVEAGFTPTHLAAASRPEETSDTALVLNVGSDDATVFRVEGSAVESVTLATHSGANAWALSADGNWAIAWTDASQFEQLDPTDSFQDVTIINLRSGEEKATRLSVGYRPTRIFFDQAGTRAYAVTEPGVSTIELDPDLGPQVGPLVQVTDDPLENPASRDVTITPDGDFAVVRRDGSSIVRLVSLRGKDDIDVELSGSVTDLDLSADGSYAAAVVREHSELVFLPLVQIVDDPTDYDIVFVEGEIFGSVSLSEDGSRALLYTNAVENDHLTMVDARRGTVDYKSHHTVALKAPVKAVFPAPDGSHAVALLSPAPGSTKAGAFSLIPTSASVAPKIVGTDAPPLSVAVAPNGEHMVVTVRDDARQQYGVYLGRMPSLQVDYLPLSSPPLSAGLIPAAGKSYVSQLHPEGRITFVDLESGSARTLTGFELGAKVVD